MSKKSRSLYLHCSVGCKSDDNELLSDIQYTGDGMVLGDGVIAKFFAGWDPKASAQGCPLAPPRSLLKVQDSSDNVLCKKVSATALVKTPFVLTTYPEGGDLFFVLNTKKTPVSLYVHMEEEDLVETLDFFSFYGKSLETLLKYFVITVGVNASKLAGGRKKDRLVASHKIIKATLEEGRLCMSLDGEQSLASNEDLLLDYPEDGDCHLIISAEPVNKKVSLQAKTPAAPTPSEGDKKKKKPTAGAAVSPRDRKEIIIKCNQGQGDKVMTLPFTFGKTTAQTTLMEFALKANAHPHQALEVVCLTCDQRSVIPDDFLLDPPVSGVYHVVDRPKGAIGQGQPGAAGCLKPGSGNLGKSGATTGGTVNSNEIQHTTPSAAGSKKKKDSSADSETKKAVMGMLQNAQQCADEGKYAAALSILAPLDEDIPDENPGKFEVLSRIGAVHQQAGNWKRAARYFQLCLDLEAGSVQHQVALGKVQVEAGQFTAAKHSFTNAINTIKALQLNASQEVLDEIRVRLGGACLMLNQVDEAIAYVQDVAKLDEEFSNDDNNNMMMNALAGANPAMAEMVRKKKQAKTNRDLALMWLSRLYAAKEHNQSAVQVASQLLIKYNSGSRNTDPKDPKKQLEAEKGSDIFKANFVWVVKHVPNAYELLRDHILTTERGQKEAALAQGWGFLGLVLRDASVLETSLQCYERSLTLDPLDRTMVLNYAHLFEQMAEVKQCNVVLLKHFQKYPNASVAGVSCKEIAAIMGDADTWPEGKDCTDVVEKMQAASKQIPAGAVASRQCVRFKDDCAHLFDSAAEADAAIPVKQYEDKMSDGGSVNKCTYSYQEQALLSLFFTVVKVFYCLGHLEPIPALLAKLDPLRKNQTLHKTPVRNEQAYFTTVAQLMQYNDPKPTAEGAVPAHDELLYLVGDSHSLSPSWQTVTMEDGQRYFAVNALVTGLKMWHVRPEGTFFPKENFARRVRQIPVGAKVMFGFGEIDCREGILRSVEKGRYKDLKEGIEVAVDYYLVKLAEIQKAQQFGHIYIHLPLPVLEPTRNVVLGCNEVMTQRLQAKNCPLRKVGASYSIVDVGRFILQPLAGGAEAAHSANTTGFTMKPEFALDGTHIAPTYLQCLQQGAVEKVA